MAALLTMAATSAAQEETVPPAADASVEAPAPAAAEAPAVAGPLAGNAETGRTLSYTCQGCHGVTGYKNAYPNFHVPLIGGQSEAYLVQALSEYKQGNRKHPTMQAQAQSFSDQDIADLAAYLSSLKK
ncbi:cytochrome C [Pseudoxanthomonas kalamensis DSM 18571]|nr:c-type cytochrome [Pseudoxanthomonas kalamensis]KAF1710047.1 cytochrome C [Pseudoxanthomonas kalamensis DSM 18571]